MTAIDEDLGRMVLDAPDEGHRSDTAATNRWDAEMKLIGWHAWLSFEEGR